MEDEVPESVVGAETSGNTSGLVGTQQGQSETVSEIIDDGVLHDTDSRQCNDMQPLSPVPSASTIPTVGRPKRDRRPNVKYSTDEYDLSAVSATRKGLLLSGVYVKQGRPKDRGRC